LYMNKHFWTDCTFQFESYYLPSTGALFVSGRS
jgi:hypothetical protein